MIQQLREVDPNDYVVATHFFRKDSAALFGALEAVNKSVEFLIVEEPTNPLLYRHAEIVADETMQSSQGARERFAGTAFAQAIEQIIGSGGSRDRLVENELQRLQAMLHTPSIGVFAVWGAEPDVRAYLQSMKDQPA